MIFFISAFDLDPLNFINRFCYKRLLFFGVWNENIEYFLCASQQKG